MPATPPCGEIGPVQVQTPVLRQPGELTAEWLSDALGSGPVEAFDVEPIGTGQMSETARVRIDYRGADARARERRAEDGVG